MREPAFSHMDGHGYGLMTFPLACAIVFIGDLWLPLRARPKYRLYEIASSTMTVKGRRRLLVVLAVVVIVIVVLGSIFRYVAMPTAQLSMVQHTFGDDISILISGYGNLSDSSVMVLILSGSASLRVPIINVRIPSINYQVGLPYSASATLPRVDLPQTVEVQTFFDTGNFDFLRTHQNVTVRVIIDGVWDLASTSFGTIHFSADTCCVQP